MPTRAAYADRLIAAPFSIIGSIGVLFAVVLEQRHAQEVNQRINRDLAANLVSGDVLLVDGTCWTNDEMMRRGVGTRESLAMGHLPQSGPGGMIESLRPFARQRKVLIHINNTNPMLVEDSPQRAELTAAGIEVSHDGMEISV